MNQVNVRLVVVPSNVPLTTLSGCDPSEIGEHFSTKTDINVDKVDSGYVILYDEDTFNSLNRVNLGKSIINLFLNQLPNTVIQLSMYYNYADFTSTAAGSRKHFKYETAVNVLEMSNNFSDAAKFGGRFGYFISNNIVNMTKIIADYKRNMGSSPVNVMSAVDDADQRDELDFYNLGSLGGSDDEVKERHKKSGGGKKHYKESRLIAKGKNPKRDYSRHGVIVSRDRDDLDKDRRVIKAFLKDFIPGNAEWKKDFRDELLDRWMEAFVISKKKLAKLEKKNRKKKKRKHTNKARNMAIDFGRRIITAADNPWADPNK